ncbi:hypothetical protein C1646_751791 [Rhizophagus diaphanus]|nr:hypothetical protein C1646_751791 [Rhizophagus diaphanus] [Rhizophagus sp. MUCL 43196]
MKSFTTTCEQNFALQGTKCTPCKQAIFKNGESDANKKPPSNKFPDTPKLDSPSIKVALDKTCADTANNACKTSGTGKVPDPTSANFVEFSAEALTLTYYLVIPIRENMCLKIVNDTQQQLQVIENQCPNITKSDNIAKSDGQKLTNQFYNYFN